MVKRIDRREIGMSADALGVSTSALELALANNISIDDAAASAGVAPDALRGEIACWVRGSDIDCPKIIKDQFDESTPLYSQRKLRIRREGAGRPFVIVSHEHYFTCLHVLSLGVGIRGAKEVYGNNHPLVEMMRPFMRNLARVPDESIEDGVVAYLRSLSREGRKQMQVYAHGDEGLLEVHANNLDHFDGTQHWLGWGHKSYLHDLQRQAGIGIKEAVEHARNGDGEDALIHVSALVVANQKRIVAAETAGNRRLVICASCATWHHYDETERIKPLGLTRYCRLCATCAKAARLQKLPDK